MRISIKQRRSVPAPVVLSPSGDFDGNDGPWSTFAFRIGTPFQTVKLLIDTSGQQTKVIGPEGCPGFNNSAPNPCSLKRGNLFDSSKSGSWKDVGMFAIGEQTNLGYVANADFGMERVGLDWQGSGGPVLQSQVVGRTPSSDFDLGLFGVSPRPTNFSSFNNQRPSFLRSLRNADLIPSLSFGYTAGAYYRLQGAPGSLTLGGYDSSLFEPNSVSFPLSPVTYRDIVLSISSINLYPSSNSTSLSSLSPEPFFAFIDGGTPHIWLPLPACQLFESAFNLTYDEDSHLYLVNDTLHTDLLARNASIIFSLKSDISGDSQVVDITLPYRSFDLQATESYPGISSPTRYFPIRRAANSSQYTLGRTFLQEAYLTVDYERQNFSISQRKFNPGTAQTIVPISSFNSKPDIQHQKGPPTGGTLALIVVGSVIGFAVVVFLIFHFYQPLRRKWRPFSGSDKNSTSDENNDLRSESGADGLEVVVLPVETRHELPENVLFELPAESDMWPSEMPNDPLVETTTTVEDQEVDQHENVEEL